MFNKSTCVLHRDDTSLFLQKMGLPDLRNSVRLVDRDGVLRACCTIRSLCTDCAQVKPQLVLWPPWRTAKLKVTRLSFHQISRVSPQGCSMHAERQAATRACLNRRNVLLEQPFVLYQKACCDFSASAQQAAGQTGDSTANAALGGVFHEAFTKELPPG
jgi:hypothetical protein